MSSEESGEKMGAQQSHPKGDVVTSGQRTSKLEVRDLGLTYGREGRGGHVVFRSVSLDVEPGEFVCLLGPSGCGKSTLLFILAGLLKPTAGEVLLHGERIDDVGRDRGLVFQDFALFPWLNVRANIAFGLTDIPRSSRDAHVEKLVGMVGLGGFESHLPHQLSGGMKQRVAIASTLATDPEVLLMDEPFGALDAQTRQELQGELVTLHETTHKTVVFVTHDIRESVLLSNRIAVMGGSPSRIIDEIEVSLPRPRNEFSEEFVEIAARVRNIMKEARDGDRQGGAVTTR